jgi:thiol-disulfide isomerase/thioredoxin
MKSAIACAALILAVFSGASRAAEPKVYDVKADAVADVKAATARAAAAHRRVLVDFGANWCGDCLALDRIFHLPENAALLKSSFEVVHADIGRFDKNEELAARFGVPLKKGVPALVVLDERGGVIYAQKNGEFESMRTMDPASVNAFLKKWKPAGSPRS